MPLMGSTAYTTLAGVNTLIRSLLNDSAGNVFSDSVLLPYVNSSYRRVQRKLANTGSSLFKTDNVLLVVPAIPANLQGPDMETVINDATPPPAQLPSNLLQPLKIWERPAGSTVEFVEMVDLTEHDGLPSRTQGAILQVWEFRTDGIYFIGATQDTQIRLRYVASLPDLIGPNDTILIRFSQEAIALGAAAAAGMARGSPLADKYALEQDDADEDLILLFIRQQQHTGRRRRPYGSRGGAYVVVG